MAAFLALFFTALIAISQGAPRPQSDVNSQLSSSNTNSSLPGGATSSTPAPPASIVVISPSQLLNALFPSVVAGGTSSNGGSVNSPLAAIISLIPNAINSERDRFGNAVETLVQNNAAAISDIIESSAATGGKFLSNGVRLVSAWPTFFGNLIG